MGIQSCVEQMNLQHSYSSRKLSRSLFQQVLAHQFAVFSIESELKAFPMEQHLCQSRLRWKFCLERTSSSLIAFSINTLHQVWHYFVKLVFEKPKKKRPRKLKVMSNQYDHVVGHIGQLRAELYWPWGHFWGIKF